MQPTASSNRVPRLATDRRVGFQPASERGILPRGNARRELNGRQDAPLTSRLEAYPTSAQTSKAATLGLIAFSLIELLVALSIVTVLALLAVPTLGKAKAKIRSIGCMNNLKQWGVALQLYAAEHDDYLPEEGSPTPGRGPLKVGWYITLPRIIGLPPYNEMPWRTNSADLLPRSIFLCPANVRRATNHNLFHYCLNGNVDGTGAADRPTKISSLRWPGNTVYVFDNGRRAAVAQQNNIHTNLHFQGAQFLFVDSHATHLRNSEYWDFKRNRGRTNNVNLIWIP